jgi:hypothetical protein
LYSFKDEKYFDSDISYYRIKQVDYDGLESFSKIVRLDNSELNQDLEVMMSNPFTSHPLIWVNQAEIGSELIVNVYSLKGERLFQKSLKTNSINEQFEFIEMESLKSGIYFVEIEQNGLSIYREKLLKMNN